MQLSFWRIGPSLIGVAATFFLASPGSAASIFGPASDYTVLYEGNGGNTLHITNVTVNGNIGVGNTGKVDDSGPSSITGRLDFSAPNTGQFSNSNGSNVGPTSVNYNVAAVTSALSTVNSLSTSLGGESGTGVSISGNQTINASAGTLDSNGNEVFNVNSYSENDGNLLTINGNGHNVVLNFSLGNVNLKGDVALGGGLTPDQVIFNFFDSGSNIQLNTNASTYSSLAFQGVILAPNDAISVVNANLNGRVFGGDTHDMQIVSGTTINTPTSVPEPSTYLLAAIGLLAVGFARRKLFTRSADLH
jgi:choice-of-anchor A domain-containing protein